MKTDTRLRSLLLMALCTVVALGSCGDNPGSADGPEVTMLYSFEDAAELAAWDFRQCVRSSGVTPVGDYRFALRNVRREVKPVLAPTHQQPGEISPTRQFVDRRQLAFVGPLAQPPVNTRRLRQMRAARNSPEKSGRWKLPVHWSPPSSIAAT